MFTPIHWHESVSQWASSHLHRVDPTLLPCTTHWTGRRWAGRKGFWSFPQMLPPAAAHQSGSAPGQNPAESSWLSGTSAASFQDRPAHRGLAPTSFWLQSALPPGWRGCRAPAPPWRRPSGWPTAGIKWMKLNFYIGVSLNTLRSMEKLH